MIERYSNPSPEAPRHIPDQDIVVDFNEVKQIVKWLITDGQGADAKELTGRQLRLNSLFMKHEISPDDPDKFKILKTKADDALFRLRFHR